MSGGGPTARRVTVRGQVQGVFFRQSAVDRARELGVAGWVRNAPDGSVELHAEGAPEAVRVLVDWAHHGPSGARVESVDVRDVGAEGAESFEVR